MRILITGSRDWDDEEKIVQELNKYSQIPSVTLVSGSCSTGADRICERHAGRLGWTVELHPADWSLGKRAGFVRNYKMVSSGADLCLAFIKDNSKGASMTKDLAEKAGIETRVIRNEERPPAVMLYPHQQEALEKLRTGSILWGGVGTGKSLVAAAYYMRVEADADVYVITTAKKRDSLDWQKEFAKFGVGKGLDSTTAGVLTIDSWNNIGRYEDVKGAFFIFDEQRLVGSGAWSSKFLRIAKANRWILLSATPGDTWLDYIPVFIANGFYRNRTDFKREHVVYSPYSKFPKVERYLNEGKLLGLKRLILVEMPYRRLTVRHTEKILVEHDKTLFDRVLKERWNVYQNRPLRDVAELFLVMRKVVNSSPSRTNSLRNLMLKHPKLIVFYNFDYELESLRSFASSITNQKGDEECLSKMKNQRLANGKTGVYSGVSTATAEEPGSTVTIQGTLDVFVVAEWNGHKHEEIPKSDSWLYLVQYAAGAEGWNCIETNAMCFYSLNYSYKMWHQAHGRIDRLNTDFRDLYYYYLVSDSVIDRAILKAISEKRNFNESRMLLGNG